MTPHNTYLVHITKLQERCPKNDMLIKLSSSFTLPTEYKQAFSVADPMTWNSQPRHLHDPVHTTSTVSAKSHFFLFSEYQREQSRKLGVIVSVDLH